MTSISTSQERKQEQHLPSRHAGRPADYFRVIKHGLFINLPFAWLTVLSISMIFPCIDAYLVETLKHSSACHVWGRQKVPNIAANMTLSPP